MLLRIPRRRPSARWCNAGGSRDVPKEPRVHSVCPDIAYHRSGDCSLERDQ
jgi:hypothetical protein